MSRNLKHRIEVLTPVSDPELKRYLKDELLAAYLRDNVKARELQPDGSYTPVQRAPGEKPFSIKTFSYVNVTHCHSQKPYSQGGLRWLNSSPLTVGLLKKGPLD